MSFQWKKVQIVPSTYLLYLGIVISGDLEGIFIKKLSGMLQPMVALIGF